MKKHFPCHICKKEFSTEQIVSGEIVRRGIFDLISETVPDWDPSKYICLSDLHQFRGKYLTRLMESGKGDLSEMDQEVLAAIKEQEVLTANLNVQFEKTLTVGEHIADRVAAFGGSWVFISLFGLVLLTWIGLNSLTIFIKPFDPYPFIFLNLILSCLAAIQAPVIMMSQNRQSAKDRLQAEHDYRVNLKAELEIRMLKEKMDRLLTHQWQRLLEIQEIQMDFMAEIGNVVKKGRST